MRSAALAVIALSLLAAAEAVERTIDFETEPGKLPGFFTSALTGDGPVGEWVVAEATGAPSGAKVLIQRSADPAPNRFPLCVYNGGKSLNVDVEVKMKAVAGEVDQAGGVIARHQDHNNFYLARANALEDNVRLYAVIQGKRTQLASADVEVAPNKWHKLRLVAVGRRLEVFFNDVSVCAAADDAIRDGGDVGLWTKADSVTQFDDFRIRPAK